MTLSGDTSAIVLTRSPACACASSSSYIIDIGSKNSASCTTTDRSGSSTFVIDDDEEYGIKDEKTQGDIQHQQGPSPQQDGSSWISIFATGLKPFGPHRWPPICICIIVVMVLAALSGELIWSRETAGEFLELDPLNVMFGPSVQILVQSGARYPPCMRISTHMPPDRRYICINATTADLIQDHLFETAADVTNQTTLSFEPSTCSLQDICGFRGFSDPMKPDQAFRFLSPLFVHSGLLHCAINLVALCWFAIHLERLMNGWRFSALFFSTGIFGNVFGANFALPTTTSSGCSPATFGLLASLYIDLAFHWHSIQQPRRHLVKLLVYSVLGFATLGLLPGIDSFSNLGGFLSGFLVSLSTVPSPAMRSQRSTLILWTLRCVGLSATLVLFFVLLNDFYSDDGSREFCTYCHYLSCLPIKGFCNQY